MSELAFVSKATHGYSEAFMEACREELTWTAEDLRNQAFRFLVAESNGRLQGFAAIRTKEEGVVELEALFVDPESTGTGVGGSLLKRIVNLARTLGTRTMTIQSDPGAVPFYKRFGACQEGESPSGSIEGRMLPVLILDLSHPSVPTVS